MAAHKRDERIQYALKLTKDCIEEVYDIYTDPDFIEIKGSIGGDMVCYRVYNDGGIYEK